jgi:hypothetical protein
MRHKRALRVERRATRREARRPAVRAKPRALAVVSTRESLDPDDRIAEYYFG